MIWSFRRDSFPDHHVDAVDLGQGVFPFFGYLVVNLSPAPAFRGWLSLEGGQILVFMEASQGPINGTQELFFARHFDDLLPDSYSIGLFTESQDRQQDDLFDA